MQCTRQKTASFGHSLYAKTGLNSPVFVGLGNSLRIAQEPSQYDSVLFKLLFCAGLVAALLLANKLHFYFNLGIDGIQQLEHIEELR